MLAWETKKNMVYLLVQQDVFLLFYPWFARLGDNNKIGKGGYSDSDDKQNTSKFTLPVFS